MKKIIFIVLVYSVGFNSLGFADSYSPSHSCSKPYKPYENDEAQEHLNAAEEAANEWNSYANYELN